MDHMPEFIKEIENFISEDDCFDIVNYINNNKNDKNKFRKNYKKDRYDSQPQKNHDINQHMEILPILIRYHKKFLIECSRFFNIKEEIYPYELWLSLMGPGTIGPLHKDNHYSAEQINFSGVIYLNDLFVGGELYFPDFNYSYKPKKNSLVIFSPDIYHEIKEVTEGYRYAMPLWGTKNKDYNFFKYISAYPL